MHWAFWVVVAIISASGRPGTAPEASESERQAAADEQTLRAAGLAADTPALLELFRARSQTGADAEEMKKLTRQLGDATPEIRARATAALIARGPAAVPALRQAANGLTDPALTAQARLCLQRIEGADAAALPAAAARLLAVRKPAGAVEALLAYLPFADDASVTEQVGQALAQLAFPEGNPDPALVSALSDALPARRATAAEALCRSDRPDQWPAVRKLLKDASAAVRLRVALALTKQHDAEPVPVLIELLAELTAAERRRAEEALQELAGDWAPAVGQMKDDAISRKIARDAWAAWWKNTEGPALLTEFRKRTLGPDDRAKARALIARLSAREFSARERASAALAAFGPRVTPLLREALKGKDAERARRAAACLERIARAEQDPLPLAAARLVGLRRPEGAAEVLLDYLPWAEGDEQADAVEHALGALALRDGKPEPALVRALEDAAPRCRQAAAEALARHGGPEGRAVVRKVLRDPDAAVRLHAALALAAAHDKEAVPALISTLTDLPAAELSPAEETLRLLAGGKGPAAPASEEPALRQKYRDAWAAWWKEHQDTADLSRLSGTEASTQLGYVLLAEVGGNGGGRVREITRDGKPRWVIENIPFPVDAYVLGGNRVLIAEYNGRRITERDFKGKILWQKDGLGNLPVNVQRLSSGHTFIATSNELLEVDRKGQTVFRHAMGAGLTAAYRTRNGRIVCLTNDGNCLWLDLKGKELKRFPSGRNGGWTSGIDVSPDGKVLVSQPGRNHVEEFDREGKSLWKAAANNVTAGTFLPGGRVLVASYNNRTVVELDRTGRTVWQFQSDLPIFRARRR